MATYTRWLDDDEQATWRSFLHARQLIDDALERQLQRDAGMPHAYYMILVALSEADGRAMRMSELARVLRYSQSRLTHAVTSMEREGWVRREPCPTDRRGQIAVLEPDGFAALERAAPGHVEAVRRVVFDRLTVDQTTQLHDICRAIVDAVEKER